ncbi:hypothetical protein pdam_00007496 [Pocillopora damicornis]|uniref:Uncharacterized protein n=1 Tax=Pocillopora damicornis TaxID=46731 RepID=A0A3M6TGK9_POCDA|nr:hypothetical protein pdam_00007496 [Pocillopora damicornis]
MTTEVDDGDTLIVRVVPGKDGEDTVLSVVSVKDLCGVLVSATKLGFDVRAPFSVVVVDDDDNDDDVAANLVDLVTTVKNLVLDVKILVDIKAVRLLKTDDRKVDEVILREAVRLTCVTEVLLICADENLVVVIRDPTIEVFFVVLCDAKEGEPWRGNKMLVVLYTGVGVTAVLVWTELGVLLKTLSSLLLEFTTRVPRVTCVERIKVSVTEVGIAVAEVGMTVVEGSISVADAGGIVTEVGMTVIEGSDTTVEVTTIMAEDIRDIVLSIPVVDFLNEEVDERELKFIETVLLAPNNVVEFCTILLDSLTSLLLSKVVWSCEFRSEDAELEVGMDDRVVGLIWVVDISVVVKFITEVSAGVKTTENAVLESNTGTELLKFAINVEDDPTIGLPLENTDGINEELTLKCPLELVTTDIADEVVLVAERVEFIDLVTALDTAVGLPLVLEAIVEFTGTSELVVRFTDNEKSESVILVKFGLRSMLENMLVN